MTAIAALLAAIVMTPVHCITVPEYNAIVQEPAATQWVDGMAGVVYLGDTNIYVTNNVCSTLSTITRKPSNVPQAEALFTLTHELGHVLSGPDECAADRYGLAHWSAIAYALGVRGHERFFELSTLVRDYGPVYLYTARCR